MRVIVFAAMLAHLSGCVTLSTSRVPNADAMKLSKDDDEMKREILACIPPGTIIEDAKEIMEKNGFECQYGRGNNYFTNREELEFGLACSRYIPQGSWFKQFVMSCAINVFISFEHGKVTTVRVSHIDTCL